MIEFIKENFLYITAIITSSKWVYEYTNKLKWERNKFLLDRLEKFYSNTNTENIHLILDWNKITVSKEGEIFKITDEILFEALKTHDIKNSFDKTELFLRNSFDEYFDQLTEFVVLAESGMVSEKNLRIFLRYWIDILNGGKKNKNKDFSGQIEKYLLFYGFDKLNYFLKEKNKFNYLNKLKKCLTQ